ncbi:MAG: hypothetical protein ACXAC8_10780 [Candidatus Hodarchaeales archaeon]
MSETLIILGRDLSKVIDISRRFLWLITGCLLLVLGFQIWDSNFDLVIILFSTRNMSVGIIASGLILAFMGVIRLMIEIVMIQPEDQLTRTDIHGLIPSDIVSITFRDEISTNLRKYPGFFVGGFLMVIGFGFWGSDFDISFQGLPLSSISTIVILIGGIIVIIGAVQLLYEVVEVNSIKSGLEEVNQHISHGLVISSCLQGQEQKIPPITSPDPFPLSDDAINLLVERSFSLLGVPQTEEGTHVIYSLSILGEQCTVVTCGFRFTELESSQINTAYQYFIISFIIRPPWAKQEDLAVYIWDNQDNHREFFNRLRKIRDLVWKSAKNRVLIREITDFRSFFTKMMLTIKKKQVTAFLNSDEIVEKEIE